MDSKTIILKTYENLTVANFDKNFLEEHGISCFLSDSNVVQLYPMFSSPFGGIKLHVFEEDEERALQLLNQIHEYDA
ncbi:MAG TPA: DUF2007 domain-containing protein [Paludibacteraceae bacterium]|nr:DUF2007 domain-containing protein [Paludibacteraceae bacterium]HQB69088.1 DUF2007 domain-containing protein [Paludibacteraceae bacterium]HRS67550.1 DUF2007 domain-containing protein [Paludibacteraceae bacterium]